MAKKRRASAPVVSSSAAFAAEAPAAVPAVALPGEAVRDDWTVALFALMMFLAPALGVPNELMLQDTLKSIVVSFAVLSAALLFFLHQRNRAEGLRWHAILWLPLLLMAYALGSMAWSHTYLAGVEAIRWFVFSVLLWLGLNTLARDRITALAWGIHGGVVIASLWTALQFWVDFDLFPQGPNPGSTFVNRNFFAEFAVCTLPFSAYLLARARRSSLVALLAASTGFVITTILMTGTRAALISLWLLLLVVLPLIAWRCRDSFEFPKWSGGMRALAIGLVLVTVVGLGAIPTGNQKIADEERGLTALARAFNRTQSIKPNDVSLGLRMVMWKATTRVIHAHPFAGVGAGAWEANIPLYQAEGSQLETDYYVHNEFLQALAEYGIVGWFFVVALINYLLECALRTWRTSGPAEAQEAPVRAVALASLLALLVCSNVGFPWRMAATGALFALNLGILAASDARLGLVGFTAVTRLKWRPLYANVAAAAAVGCLALAFYITTLAAECENKIIRAAKIALTISASGDYHNARWIEPKREMLALIRDGIRINPHYRKITPIVADELARWGDWNDAIWVWESVLSSRPYVVAIISNVARGYVNLGQMDKATAYLERARRLQPHAPAVASLEVIILGRTGQEAKALQLTRNAIAQRIYDYDLVNAAFTLAVRAHDWDFARQAIDIRVKDWPDSRVGSYLQLGNMYANDAKQPERALEAYKLALVLSKSGDRPGVLAQVPQEYRSKLEAAPQTSANSR